MQTDENPLSLTIRPETAFAPARGGDTHIVVELEGVARPGAAERRPLNLAIVLDRSGSMADLKLDIAKNAALHLIHRLDARDRVAVVIYDEDVELLIPSTAVIADRLPTLSMALAPVGPGGSTNLEGGWHAGVRAVAGAMEQMPGAMHRVLLLTDGLANVGITDPGALASLARGAAAHGIVTSTFGVGSHYDEQLLNAMAEAGAGNAYHIATPGRIHPIFQAELAELMTVVASGVSVRVTLPPGLPAQLRNPAIDAAYDLPRVTIPVGFVSVGETPRFTLRLALPPAAPGSAHAIRATVRWQEGTGHAVARAALSWAVAGETGPRDPAILAEVARQEAARARHEAYLSERAGDYLQAASTLRKASASIAAYAPIEAAAEIGALQREASEMAEGSSEAQRKRIYNDMNRIKRGKQIEGEQP
jgi:Ca-activated chloride channel family protein